MNKIYLDYAATTPVDPRVIEAMTPFFRETFGNPSSLHGFGQKAEAALENARNSIAENMGANPAEIIFTSCGTESDNLALRGAAFARREKFDCSQILITPLEHPAIQSTADQLSSNFGFEIKYIPVNEFGEVEYDEVEKLLSEKTAVVSVMGANNEIGTINDISRVVDICKEWQIPVHTDAVQSAAHSCLNVENTGIDLVSIGAHKFYGPKGIGALYVRTGTDLIPWMTGGSQEFGLRAATHNIPLIVGMAKAFALIYEEERERREKAVQLRDRIIAGVLESIPSSKLTGSPGEGRLPNHASFVFEGVDGNLLLQVLDQEGFACSSGSACKTGDPKPSRVLTNLGYPDKWALGSLRVTVGKDTANEEVSQFLEILPDCIMRVREVAG